jgi:hypothetical protein
VACARGGNRKRIKRGARKPKTATPSVTRLPLNGPGLPVLAGQPDDSEKRQSAGNAPTLWNLEPFGAINESFPVAPQYGLNTGIDEWWAIVGRVNTFLDRVLHRGALRRWGRIADEAEEFDLETLRTLRAQSRQLRRQLDRLIRVGDARLALPVVGSNAIRTPMGTDWSWRPALWREPIAEPGMTSVPPKAVIDEGATIFHDCTVSELTARQIRNTGAADLAPFGIRLDVFRFDGSFLSLVLDLPEAATRGLKLRHLVRLDMTVELEKPLEIFARLNIKHGPNVEQIVREFPLSSDEIMVEFDLGYSRINEKRIERMWVDLIFEGPEMNQIILRDVTLSRRPRAEL